MSWKFYGLQYDGTAITASKPIVLSTSTANSPAPDGTYPEDFVYIYNTNSANVWWVSIRCWCLRI